MSRRWLGFAVILVFVGCGGSSKRGTTPNGQTGAIDAGNDVPVGGGRTDGGDTGAPSGSDTGGGADALDARGPDGGGVRDVIGDVTGDASGDVTSGGDGSLDGQVPGKPAYIIDDMERADMAAGFLSPAGIMAKWSAVANYVVGQQVLPSASAIIRRLETPRGTSDRAAMLSSAPVEDGADLFIDLRPLTGTNQHVDLSRYTGIAFWSRIVGGRVSDPRHLFVAIKDDRYPIDNEEFWVGQTMTTPWFSAGVSSGAVWQRHEISFDQFRQRDGLGVDPLPNPSSPLALRTSAIASIHFTTIVGAPFEIWIDDLVLCEGRCPGEEPPGPRVCTPGADQTCNDNPAISSLHGMCTPASVCVCRPQYAKNPATGKCL